MDTTLNSSYTVRIATTPVTVHLQTLCHTIYVATFMIYLRNKFHTPSFNGSLVIAIKPKAVKKTARSPFCYRFNKNSILFPVPITTHHFRILEFVTLANYRVTSTRANRNVLLPSSWGLWHINKCDIEMSSKTPIYLLPSSKAEMETHKHKPG
jgi:hypothetical protein